MQHSNVLPEAHWAGSALSFQRSGEETSKSSKLLLQVFFDASTAARAVASFLAAAAASMAPLLKEAFS